MEKFYDLVIRCRRLILFIFIAAAIVCAVMQGMVSVNYDINAYLPEDSASTTAIDVMQEEFGGGIPNARVMVRDVSLAEALDYKEALEQIDGVDSVTWLDDSVNLEQPLEIVDDETVEAYYKDGNALFTVTIQEEKILSAVADIRELIGEENAMTGSAVSQEQATTNTVGEVRKITVIGVLFVFFILLLTTTSWFEPVVVMAGLGIAILLNAGTNLIFGEISFVTNAAGNILQLAVSLDYSVFLIHRFEECRMEKEPEAAMREALCKSTASILSSGLTTVIGFLALVLMRFRIGPDLGLALAKGVAISLITVFIFMPGLILATYRWMDKTQHREFLPKFRVFGKVVRKVMIPCVCVFTVLIVPAYLSSIHNDYYYGASHIFGQGTRLGDDTQAVQDIFGKSDTYVLLVPKGDTAKETELCEGLKEMSEVTNVLSWVELAGAEIPYEYLDEATLSQLESENYSRLVLSVNADYEGEETFVLVERIRRLAQEYYPDTWLLAGEGVSTCDLMNTVTEDMAKVNLVAVGAVFVVLLFTLKSLSLSVILVLTIETAVWINLAIPYYMGTSLFYIAYLIISSVQLGATVDYAILFTTRYEENRERLNRREAVVETVSNVTSSILTSGTALTVVGFLLGIISTNGLLSQLGYLLGRGTVCSLICVMFVLPGFLYLTDRLFIERKNREGKGENMNKNRKKAIKVTAAALAAAMVLCDGSAAVMAAETPSKKEEVVYAMLDGTGSVKGVYVVNSVEGGDVVDYGTYTDVKNLTSEDAISMDGDEITFHTDEDRVYYQGNLAKKDIPWNIAITYSMDGKTYSAQEIAGMSGAFEVTIAITQNENCDESFWEGYALQATVTLDGNKCRNITAEGATVANVGSDKQLSYIVLPGKEQTLTVAADVMDFEMGAITINGVRLNLDMSIDENEINDKISEVQDAVDELDSGAKELADGAGEVSDGARELADGIGSFSDGTKSLREGVDSVSEGAGSLSGGAAALDEGAGALVSGAGGLYDGAISLDKGAKEVKNGALTLNDGISQVEKALDELNEKSETLTNGSKEVKAALAAIQTALSEVSVSAEELTKLSESSAAIGEGIGSLVQGLSALDGTVAAYQEALGAAGITDTESYVEQHRQVIAGLNITDTQRALYEASASGGDSAVVQKLTELAMAGDAEAAALSQEYADAGNDASVIDAYVTKAGTFLAIEQLLTADIAYIQGSDTLISGIDASLENGTGELMTGAKTLWDSYAVFDAAIQSMVTELGGLSQNMAALKTGIDTLVTQYTALDGGIGQYTGAVADIVEGYEAVSDGAKGLAQGTGELYTGTQSLVNGSGALKQGAADLKSGTGELKSGSDALVSGTSELAGGSADLVDGVSALLEGADTLADGTRELYDGTKELSDGTGEFVSETADMDDQVSDTISDMVDEVTGKNVPTVSFVSEKNTNVESVLFVIKTDAIEKEELEAETVQKEENLSFWQKVKQLFGI